MTIFYNHNEDLIHVLIAKGVYIQRQCIFRIVAFGLYIGFLIIIIIVNIIAIVHAIVVDDRSRYSRVNLNEA